MAHRSRAASLRRTSQSAAASRARSVPSASSCRTVVRSRVTFFIGHCRSTRTPCLKDRHGESKIQRKNRPRNRAPAVELAQFRSDRRAAGGTGLRGRPPAGAGADQGRLLQLSAARSGPVGKTGCLKKARPRGDRRPSQARGFMLAFDGRGHISSKAGIIAALLNAEIQREAEPTRFGAVNPKGMAATHRRTRTRKCRSEKISLKHPMNPLAFQNILGREIFRGGAANDLTCGSGAKTGQFEIDCPPGRALTTGVLARMVALFPPASPWWHGLPRLSKSATACSLCAGLCAQRERVCGYEHRA